MFTVILLQLSAPLTVRMVVPVYLLMYVNVQMNGLEVVVKDVSTNLSRMGVGQHVIELALSYSFLYSLYVHTVCMYVLHVYCLYHV